VNGYNYRGRRHHYRLGFRLVGLGLVGLWLVGLGLGLVALGLVDFQNKGSSE